MAFQSLYEAAEHTAGLERETVGRLREQLALAEREAANARADVAAARAHAEAARATAASAPPPALASTPVAYKAAEATPHNHPSQLDDSQRCFPDRLLIAGAPRVIYRWVYIPPRWIVR